MDDSSQIDVPPSFVQLYLSRSGQRLLKPVDWVRERYELCEDIALASTERATSEQFRTGAQPPRVLADLRTALGGAGSPLLSAEANWVAHRVAELLGWPEPPADEG